MKYNRPTPDESAHKGYVPYPQDLKVHQAFAELENRNQGTFEFDREALDDKVEIPADFKADRVLSPEDLNRKNVSESDYKSRVFGTGKYSEYAYILYRTYWFSSFIIIS